MFNNLKKIMSKGVKQVQKQTKQFTLPTPKQMVEELDKYIIGQEKAKKALSLAVYNHYKRLFNNSHIEQTGVEFQKSNCLIVGPTGVGKTYMLQILSRMLNVGLYIGNATNYTASGYVGQDVESCLTGLLQVCNNNIQLTEMSILVIDEIDKITKKDAGPSITRDVSGECVQQSFLKMVEGDIVGVPPVQGRIHPEQQLIHINTKNILFIGTGAFVGIENIIKSRMGKNKIGFENSISEKEKINDNDILNYITGEDLKQYGFIPEFIGRFPIITNMDNLSEDDLVKILKEPKNAILKQYSEMLKMDNTTLEFTDDALKEIGKVAKILKTGARALRSIVEVVLEDIMFNAPENRDKKKSVTITVDSEYVKNKTEHLIKFVKAA